MFSHAALPVARDVYPASYRRRCNVRTLHRRWRDVAWAAGVSSDSVSPPKMIQLFGYCIHMYVVDLEESVLDLKQHFTSLFYWFRHFI